jgi:signal transduction histidine kinase
MPTEEQLRAEIAALTTQLRAERRERRRTEEELRLAQRLEAVGQLASGVAHEINTPTQYCMDNTRFFEEAFGDLVKVLRSYEALAAAVAARDDVAAPLAEVAKTRDAVDVDFLLDDLPEAIEQSLTGLRQVATIVRALKDFSHPGSGSMAPVRLADLVRTTVLLSRGEHKYVADVVVSVPDDLPEVPCREGSIKQVLLNLIVNAAHAVSSRPDLDRGTIEVWAEASEEQVRVEVRDDGCGIPKRARDRVFDLFFTTKEVGEGTGQGLALAHRVIREEHGGRLGFDTEEGVGTTFWFELPLQVASSAGEEPGEGHARDERGGQRHDDAGDGGRTDQGPGSGLHERRSVA